MKNYEIKKIQKINHNKSLGDCKKNLISEEYCFGISDDSGNVFGFITVPELERALKFDISTMPVGIITTLAEYKNINPESITEKEADELLKTSLNKGLLIGKNQKEITHILLKNTVCGLKQDFNLENQFNESFSENIKKALKLCSSVADRFSIPIYLIGGGVRDIILNKKCFDIDITVQGNAIEFCKKLVEEYPEIAVLKEIHDDFKTAKIIFQFGNEKVDIDFASTRKEYYKTPASLPVIEEIECDVCDDIDRRDFTINSMAISLNEKTFCKLIDPQNGYEDLKNRIIRIMHPVSFVDDPTRIIRALKFAVRFDCQIEKATKYLLEECINSGLFNNIGTERVKSEIKQTFGLNSEKAFDEFVKERLYLLISENIEEIKDKLPEGAFIKSKIKEYEGFLEDKRHIWLVYLGCLISNLCFKDVSEICTKLNLTGQETKTMLDSRELISQKDFIKNARTNFEIYEILKNYPTEAMIIALIDMQNEEIEEKIKLYLTQLRHVVIKTSGKDLIQKGISPGPVFGEFLREILKARLNGIISEEEEAKYLEKIIQK